MKLTLCEVQHIKDTLNEYSSLIEGYPEVVTDREEDQLKIAQEIMREDSDT